MGVLLGLLFAAGALTIMHAVATPRAADRLERAREQRTRRLRSITRALGFSLLTGLVSFVVTGVPTAGLLGLIVGAMLPWLLRRRAEARGARARREAWPDAIDMTVSGIRSGVPLAECLLDLRVRGPVPLRGVFAEFGSAYEGGHGLQQSLDRLHASAADPSADRFIMILRLAHAGGGHETPRMLATLSEFLRSDLRLRAEIEARQSWTTSAARLAVAAPWVAMVLLAARSDAAQAYSSPEGSVLLVVTACVSVTAYLLMRRLSRLAPQRRLASA